ncbi:MAG: GNAT family N-acetyltransferase [Armatimonadetes bacterium]|nr:GNAT family N-acetyltransferase [Armatimonadota bacterium]
MAVVVRAYRGDDESALLALWAAALPYDAVDADTFRRKVLLDPNFRAEGLAVAEEDGRLLGFCLGLVRHLPFEGVGLDPDRGWITAMGVQPARRREGIGTALLAQVNSYLLANGRATLVVAGYLPNYFVPGVDIERYADGVAFLQHRGFETVSEALSMDANLVRFDFAPYQARAAALAERGVTIRALAPADIPPFLDFLRDQMPADWVRHAREQLTEATRGRGRYEQFSLALRGPEIVGYCQFEDEHFGPFGVRDDHQGQGIGTVLLAHSLETMRRHGHHNAWVLWTSQHTADHVYGRFGFALSRRFAILRRTVS